MLRARVLISVPDRNTPGHSKSPAVTEQSEREGFVQTGIMVHIYGQNHMCTVKPPQLC